MEATQEDKIVRIKQPVEAARKGGGKESVREKMMSEYKIGRTANYSIFRRSIHCGGGVRAATKSTSRSPATRESTSTAAAAAVTAAVSNSASVPTATSVRVVNLEEEETRQRLGSSSLTVATASLVALQRQPSSGTFSG